MDFKNTSFGRTQSQLLSVINLIQWGEHYSVDHPGIDAQHKKIFDLGLNVYENWRNGGSGEELRLTVEKLAGLLEAHCYYEERLLAEIGYEDLEKHVAEHRRMLGDMGAMKEAMNEHLLRLKDGGKAGGSMLAADWPVMHFFLGFIVGHVITSDMGYCKSLIAGRSSGKEHVVGA